MPRFGRFFGIGSSSASGSSRRAENEPERRSARRETPAASADPRLAELSSRPAPPRHVSRVEQEGLDQVRNEIKPNLVAIFNKISAALPYYRELQRAYDRAADGIARADKLIAGQNSAISRDDLAHIVDKCIRDYEKTGAQHQRVEAQARRATSEPMLNGSRAGISNEVMTEAMNILCGLESKVDAPRITEWQRLGVIDLLQDIQADKQVSHAAVYHAYRNSGNAKALIETLVAYIPSDRR